MNLIMSRALLWFVSITIGRGVEKIGVPREIKVNKKRVVLALNLDLSL